MQHGSRETGGMPSDLATMDSMPYDLAENEADVRGYDVYDDSEQKIGTIENLIGSPSQERAYSAVVNAGSWLNDRRVVVPTGQLGVDQIKRRVYVPFSREEFQGAPAYEAGSADYNRYSSYWSGLGAGGAQRGTDLQTTRSEGREIRVPEVEETAEVHKRMRQTGWVQLRRRVETETKQISTPVTRTEVGVERHDLAPGEAVAVDPNATTLREGETIRMPIMEEEVVVEKTPRVTGEVVVRTRTETEQDERDVTLRKERVEVDEDVDETEELETGRKRNA
jgi:uncharacterized protein (TIGR02271 family)